jgi:hypothetical protein
MTKERVMVTWKEVAEVGRRPTQVDEKGFGPAITLYGTVAPSVVIPSVPGFPASLLSPATPDVVLFKENHTQPTEAATLDRKSGEAEGSAVSLSLTNRPVSVTNILHQLIDHPLLIASQR